jgi:hypothetical protein
LGETTPKTLLPQTPSEYANLHPLVLQKAVQALTLSEAIQLDEPTKKQLSQHVREGFECEMFLANQIMKLGDYLEKTISLEKACQMIGDLIEVYYYYTINDVLLLLKKGRQATYNEEGQISIQFNAQTLMNWAAKYDLERTEYISKQRIAESQRLKNIPTDFIQTTALPEAKEPSKESGFTDISDFYKNAQYNPEQSQKQNTLRIQKETKEYKARFEQHKANGTLTEFLDFNQQYQPR